jgi:hypothetical protein
MTLSLYDISVPVFIRGFANLSHILNVGRGFADEKGIAHAELLEARLIADMGPLTSQIQRASDTAKFTAIRVGKVENVAMADNEASFEALQARIQATVDFLKRVPPASMEGRDEEIVTLKTGSGAIDFTARNYVLDFAIPNFYFHVTTAYAILRHKGAPLGKLDFLGKR